MRYILLAHTARHGDLTLLPGGSARALLPVLDKPLLVHALEDLVEAGVSRITVTAGADAQTVTAVLGDGRRWGVEIDILPALPEESTDRIARRLLAIEEAPLCLVQGDAMCGRRMAAFLDAASSLTAERVAGLGVLLIRPDGEGKAVVRPAPGTGYSPVATLDEWHTANMDALAGKYRCLLIEGRSVIERTGAEGELLLAGQGARVAPEALESGQALVGRRALVGRGTALAGGVVIGSGSVVGAGTRLENVVVWPGTGVGDQLAVSRGILAGDLLIRLTDRGAEVTRITDPFLLTDLSLASPVAWFAGLRDRCAAILLLLLTAPLWVLLIAGGVRQRTVLGNRRTPEGAARPLRLWEGRRGPAWLRMIPGLPAVAAGHLRLTGVCPLTPEEDAARTTSWEHARDGRPVGLWGAAQVALGADAPLQDRLLADLCAG
jgi:hypothetical protein